MPVTDYYSQKRFTAVVWLAVFSVAYNVAEGIICVLFGIEDDSIALSGFGIDSFIETLSAMAVLQMIFRIRHHPDSEKTPFEITALRITGWCLYALACMLLVSATWVIFYDIQPSTTLPGVIISSVSILVMWIIIRMKIRLGKQLNSPAIVADARCNQVCVYMSVVLLASSAAGYWLHGPYVEAAGAAGIAWFSFTEGREANQKASGLHDCHDHCH